jgi:hypothetical protein
MMASSVSSTDGRLASAAADESPAKDVREWEDQKVLDGATRILSFDPNTLLFFP